MKVPHGAEGFRIFCLSGNHTTENQKSRRECGRRWSKGTFVELGVAIIILNVLKINIELSFLSNYVPTRSKSHIKL